jgi:ribonuclease P protein subunit RPR2
MDTELAVAQALRYAEELKQLHGQEREHRKAAEDAYAKLADSYGTTVRALAAALELRDDATGSHADRVAKLALEVARIVDPGLASDRQLEYGFLLHDLGKIGVPDAILLMRDHPILGERIVARVPFLCGVARQVVAAHHERWDGSGYPRRLQGLQIPVAARIFSIADAFDAMTNERPYRAAMKLDATLAEIRRGSGTQFEPRIVDAFLSLAEFQNAA